LPWDDGFRKIVAVITAWYQAQYVYLFACRIGGDAIVEADGVMLGRQWTQAIPGALLI
jgi:hypothetical protein